MTNTKPSTALIVLECVVFLYSFRLFCFVCNSKLCTRWPIFISVICSYLIFIAIPSVVVLSSEIVPNIRREFEKNILYYSLGRIKDTYHDSNIKREDLYFQKQPFLLSNITQTSYIGHDAIFTCSPPQGYNAPAWINTNDRHTISETYYHEREDNIPKGILNHNTTRDLLKYNLPNKLLKSITNQLKKNPHMTKSQLEIRDIEEKDFKMYRCVYDIFDTVVLSQEFSLKKQEFKTVDVYAAPGTLIHMAPYYRHLDNSEDITIYHTLNGKIITFDDSQCPYLLLYYYYSTRSIAGSMQLWNSLQRVNQFEIDANYWNLIGNFRSSLTSWCMTPELYGLHSTVVVRRFQNTSGSSCSIKHINQPLSLNIKYTESNSFENTERHSEIDCWGPEEEPDSVLCALNKRLLYKDAELIYKTDRYYILGMLVSVILFLIFLWYIFHIFIGGVDMETLAGISDRRNAEEKYNIFISCVQQDYRFVQNKILPILENKLGRKVFVPVRDVSPSRPITTDTGEAISQSASVIVIASRRYIKDRILNKFEINMVVQNASKHNLIIVRLDDCYIADIFNDKYQVIDLRKQHNRFQLETELEKLPLYRSPRMKWVKMILGYVNVCIGLYTIFTQIRIALNWLMLLWMVLNGTDVDD
ncbi:hypothetical protein SNE40_022295 [Patella caerulea]|uniref:TIR domain-containing protein n=1 Tax=Patella caerulea TaxID=87958 RepID=A0AAN8G0B4_PATCE